MTDDMSPPEDTSPHGGRVAREQIVEQVREWCANARIDVADSALPELSDDAAILIASAYLDESTRTILTARRRVGRTLPSIGGFERLRRWADERRRLDASAAAQTGAKAAVQVFRASEIGKRIEASRTTFVASTTHYANTLRAIRRERRAGIHLDPNQRSALFDALSYTPMPNPAGTLDQIKQSALSMASGLAQRTWFGGRLADLAPVRSATFTDRVDTLLYLAGSLFDQVDGSPAWQSDHFEVQRVQLDLAAELTAIAADAVALRDIDIELDAAFDTAHVESARDEVRTRRRALEPVWDQLVVRVAALARIADLLRTADDHLRSMTAVRHTRSLDSRIDQLVARSGDRELSAANTHFVGDQLDDADGLPSGYQTWLSEDIRALTDRRGVL